jgi:carboxypeptidase C (cathepsin A)
LNKRSILPLLIAFTLSLTASTQQKTEPKPQEKTAAKSAPIDAKKSAETAAAKPAEKKDDAVAGEEAPVITHHSIRAGGKTLNYTATTGMMPIKNGEGEVEARMFFMAYTLDGPHDPKRPLMVSFNGGPGSSSVWLHLGLVGPKRIKMLPDGTMTPPPFELVDNEYTMLDQTDIVFVDPVGTGYSRAAKKELNKKFWGLKGDLDSVSEFIRMYLTRYERWSSPLFLIGESYGTMRASGLAGTLIDRGIAVNGIALISTVLDFNTIEFNRGSDAAYIYYLPTYAATAWYHKKIAPELQRLPVKDVVRQAEEFAGGPYAAALMKGDALSEADRKNIIAQLAKFTGLSPQYIENSDLRVEHVHFAKELLRDQGLTVGRLDSRFKGKDESNVGETFEYDPSYSNIQAPYTAMLNDYVRRELGYRTDTYYSILGNVTGERWDWGSAGDGAPNTTEGLRKAFVRNPHMRVYIAKGYYDMATPLFAVNATFNHMALPKEAKANISDDYFEAGHMMYIEQNSLTKLRDDLRNFVNAALKK